MIRPAVAGLMAILILAGTAHTQIQSPEDKCAAAKMKLAERKIGSLLRCLIRRDDFGCSYNLTCCEDKVKCKFSAKFRSLEARYLRRGITCGGATEVYLEDLADRTAIGPTPLPVCTDPSCTICPPCCL